MERMMFGWKKSVKIFHFFEEQKQFSVCLRATYKITPDTSLEFFSEIELEPGTNYCPECYSIRKAMMRNKIVHEFHESASWNDKQVCPNCKSKVIFWDTGRTKEHFCTICKKMVVMQ